MPTVAPDPAAAEQAFVIEVLRGMAALCGGDGAPPGAPPEDLTIPLGMSAWIVRASIGLPDAYEALAQLRPALVAAAGLDLRTEPVPLRTPEPRAALTALATYLFGLVHRGARHAGCSTVDLAESVLHSGAFAVS